MQTINAVAHTTKEFTFIEPLSDGECFELIMTSKAEDIAVIINQSCRIAIFECDELQDATSILQDCNLIPNIAQIREVTEWDIVDMSDEYPLNILTNLESDNDD